MSKIFNKRNLTAASPKKRGIANMFDLFVFLVVAIIMANISLTPIEKVLIVASYILIYLPLAYAYGATIGQLIVGIRLRKYNDYDKKINIFEAYKRIFLLLANYLLGIFSFFRENKFLYDKLSNTISLELQYSEEDDEVVVNIRKKSALIRGIFAGIVYSCWVIWVGNFWLLIGNIVIYDIYISKKVPWNFWKKTKNGEKPKAWVEWVDALLFALVAVYFINLFLFQNYKIPTSSLEKSLLVGDHLFVSKVTYGPRIPNTPLSFPLLQNTVPILNTKSYFEWPQWKYKRLKGLKEVEKGDIVVFNFPTGDTVTSNFPNLNPDFYITCRREGIKAANTNPSLLEKYKNASQWELNSKLRQLGKENILLNNEYWGDFIYRPVDRRDNYVKRCIAVAGDTFEIRHNQVYINGVKTKNPKGLQHWYNIITDGTKFNQRFLDKLEISNEDARYLGNGPTYTLPLTEEKANMLKEYPFIRQMNMAEEVPDSNYTQVWPYSTDYNWSRDNFGPLWIPKKGATVKLSLKNLVLYDRIITAYEGNTLDVKNGEIYINGTKQDEYTFNMNYYFMLGDNRHQSADSRYWGFVPEDHVVGRPLLVWLSLNKDKSLFEGKIRFDRFFKWVANEQ